MTDFSNMSDDDLLAAYQQAKAGGKVRAMPGGVVNKLNEDIDAIGLASQMNARLIPYKRDLESKKLDLGPVRNLFMKGQNAVGMSTPQSREFATFRSDIEKMRNDSLRLNKGVQTEGDATRAMNELLSNFHDEKLVAERIGQIQGYNEQDIRRKKGVVDETRKQYGMGPPDYGKIEVAPKEPNVPERAHETYQRLFKTGKIDPSQPMGSQANPYSPRSQAVFDAIANDPHHKGAYVVTPDGHLAVID